MAKQPAISTYQPSWLTHERHAAVERHSPPHQRRWGAALIGVLLASAAGVYSYRQFAAPAYSPEEPSTGAPSVGVPAQPFPPPLIPLTTADAREATIAAVETRRTVPPERPALASRTRSRPSFAEAFDVDSHPPVLLSVRSQPNADPPQPEPATESVASSGELATAIPISGAVPETPAAVPSAGRSDAAEAMTRGLGASIANLSPDKDIGFEPVPDIQLASADSETAPSDLAPGHEVQAALEPSFLTTETVAEVAVSDVPREDIEPPTVLASVNLDDLPGQAAPRAQRAIPRRQISEAAIEAAPATSQPALVRAAPAPARSAASPAAETPRSANAYVQHYPMVIANGAQLGAITLREFRGNQRQVHLGALLSLFKLRMDPAEYERLLSSAAANQFMNLEDLGKAGLDARYDPVRERLIIGFESDSAPLRQAERARP